MCIFTKGKEMVHLNRLLTRLCSGIILMSRNINLSIEKSTGAVRYS